MESLFIQLPDDVKISISQNYDWFCGPGSQMKDSSRKNENSVII